MNKNNIILYNGYYNTDLSIINESYARIDLNKDKVEYIKYYDANNNTTDIINLKESKRILPNELAEDACSLMGRAKLITYYISRNGEYGYYYGKVMSVHQDIKKAAKQKKCPPEETKQLQYNLEQALLKFYGEKSDYFKNLLIDVNGETKRYDIRISSHKVTGKPNDDEISIVFPDKGTYNGSRFNLNDYSRFKSEYIEGQDFITSKEPQEIANDLYELIKKARTTPITTNDILVAIDDSARRTYDKGKEYQRAIKILKVDHPHMDNTYKEIIRLIISNKSKYITDMKSLPKYKNPVKRKTFWAIFNRILTPEEMATFKKTRSEYDKHRYDLTGGAIPSSQVRGYNKFFDAMTELITSPNYKDGEMTYEELYQYMLKHNVNWSKKHLLSIIKTYNYENPTEKFIPKLQRADRYEDFKEAIFELTDGATKGSFIFPINDWLEHIKNSVGIDMKPQNFRVYYKKLQKEYPELILLKTRKLNPVLLQKVENHIIDYCKNSYGENLSLEDWIEYFKMYDIEITPKQMTYICQKIEESHPDLGKIIKESFFDSKEYSQLFEIYKYLNAIPY